MNYVANPYEQYRQQGVMTAKPIDLVIMLYEGCIKQLKLAKIHINDNTPEKANSCLKKAQDIVVELLMGLDFNYEISNNLMKLYDFMINEIVDVNLTKKTEKIDPVIDILQDLNSAWTQIRNTQHAY